MLCVCQLARGQGKTTRTKGHHAPCDISLLGRTSWQARRAPWTNTGNEEVFTHTDEHVSVYPVEKMLNCLHNSCFNVCETQFEYMRSDLDPYAQGCSNEKIFIEGQAQKT